MSQSAHHSLQQFLDRLTLRSVLTAEEQQAFLRLPAQSMSIAARRDFVHQNQAGSHACFIASGLVGRFSQTATGMRQITAFHIPGDMADLHSVVRPVGMAALQALSTTTVLRVPHDALRRLAARFPAIGEALWRDCMVDTAMLMQWVVNVGRRNAQTRVAHLLCEMAVRFGGEREALHDYAFPITQEQLGDATALTPVHVNRTLKSLRDCGLVTFRSGKVQIHAWSRLAQVGDFDVAYLDADTRPARQTRLLQSA